MKNTWRNIFIALLIITSIILIFTPIIFKFPMAKDVVYWWVESIYSHIDGYFVLLGTILGSSLTIAGAMWQSERNINIQKISVERKNLNYLFTEIEENEKIIDLILDYFKTNKINKIVFNQDSIGFTFEEWTIGTETKKALFVDDNKGIRSLKAKSTKKFIIDELQMYPHIESVRKLYTKFDVFELANGYDDKFIEATRSLLSIVKNEFIDYQKIIKRI